jgi:hypothetical protein
MDLRAVLNHADDGIISAANVVDGLWKGKPAVKECIFCRQMLRRIKKFEQGAGCFGNSSFSSSVSDGSFIQTLVGGTKNIAFLGRTKQ